MAGAEVLIVNEDTADGLQVWPASGDAIDGGSVDAVDPTELEHGGSRKYFAVDGTNWYTGIADELTSLHITHTASEAGEHALEISADAAGFGDVKAIGIDYITGAIAAGFDDSILLVNIDESLATGGEVHALEVLSTTGSALIEALHVGVGVAPVHQSVGTFVNMDSALVNAVDRLAEFTSAGSDIAMFVADNDTVTLGDAAKFGEIEFLLATVASGGGVKPTFEFSTGVGTWSAFTPTDGTNGFRNSGIIDYDPADLSGWAVGTGSEFLIRITRTANNLSTVPVEDLVQTAAVTNFTWGADGALSVLSLALSTALAVEHGGTGVSTLTDGGVLLGSGTGAITAMAVLADGEFIVGNGTTDPVPEGGATVRTSLGLGTAAVENVGVADGDVPQMDATGYPAADGSQITGIGGGPSQATQAALEAETNEDTYAPPDLIKHNPGVAKVQAEFTVAGSINHSRNVDSITDNGVGRWTVNITTDFSSANYEAFASGNPDKGATTNLSWGIVSLLAGSYIVSLINGANGAANDPDSGNVMTVAFGDQ